MTSKWFSLNGKYTNDLGISAEINGNQMQLSRKDVDFLLNEIGPKADAASAQPGRFTFTLHGRAVVVSIEDWWTFQEHLTSAVGEGGWLPFGDSASDA